MKPLDFVFGHETSGVCDVVPGHTGSWRMAVVTNQSWGLRAAWVCRAIGESHPLAFGIVGSSRLPVGMCIWPSHTLNNFSQTLIVLAVRKYVQTFWHLLLIGEGD
jgi:hypothetical protein